MNEQNKTTHYYFLTPEELCLKLGLKGKFVDVGRFTGEDKLKIKIETEEEK